MRPQVISVPYSYDRFEEGLGLGPGRLLELGLAQAAAAVHVANLAEEDREPERTAVNIGKLGHSTADLVAQARSSGDPVVVVAGDDTAIVGVVAGLQKADGASRALGIIWFDAHGDFNTPDTSYSGILAGMPLAVIAGLAGPRWRDAADLGVPIAGERLLIAGTRDVDAAEEALLESHSVQRVDAAALREPERFSTALARLTSTCETLMVNIDLDVLSPHLVPSTTTPSDGGLELGQLGDLLDQVLSTGLVALISMTSLNPLGGARGQTAAKSGWTVLERALANWRRVPPPRAAF
ncbi:MAG: arginase family protein [Chloroflexota bacterium]|nr:arginase family protein [Chloroflexota bacterium]